VPGQHPHSPRAGPDGQFVEQPGLAHARVTGEQDCGRPAAFRPLEVREQAVELVGPAHQRGVVPA
jgi:hypothetical protein